MSWQKVREKQHLETEAEYVITEETEGELTRTVKFTPRFGAVAGYDTGEIMFAERVRGWRLCSSLVNTWGVTFENG